MLLIHKKIKIMTAFNKVTMKQVKLYITALNKRKSVIVTVTLLINKV